ncbi:MAG: hypothetical protein ABIP89_21800, partial [Polyangiaceae bacterium]
MRTRNARLLAVTCAIALAVAVGSVSGGGKKSRGPTFEVAKLAVGGVHACAWMKDGSTSCWGWNDAGELGASAPLRRGIRRPVRT